MLWLLFSLALAHPGDAYTGFTEYAGCTGEHHTWAASGRESLRRTSWNGRGDVVYRAELDPETTRPKVEHHYTYDRAGHRVRVDHDHGRKHPMRRTLLEWDGPDGQISRVLRLEVDSGEVLEERLYEYDAQGRRVRELWDGEVAVEWYRDETPVRRESHLPGFAPRTRLYDEDHHLIADESAPFEGRPGARTERVWEGDRLVELERTVGGVTTREESHYDANGRLAEELVYRRGVLTKRVTYTWDDAGRRLSMESDRDLDGAPEFVSTTVWTCE